MRTNARQGKSILMDGQRHRFVQIPSYAGSPGFVLSDIGYWMEHYDELVEWIKTTSGRVAGMTVEFDNEQDMILFLLKWS